MLLKFSEIQESFSNLDNYLDLYFYLGSDLMLSERNVKFIVEF